MGRRRPTLAAGAGFGGRARDQGKGPLPSRLRLNPEALKAQRISAGVSREAVALAIDRSYETVKLYEMGKVAPPVEILLKLADCYECPFSAFFETVAEVV